MLDNKPGARETFMFWPYGPNPDIDFRLILLVVDFGTGKRFEHKACLMNNMENC
jgi:hypothetical protein